MAEAKGGELVNCVWIMDDAQVEPLSQSKIEPKQDTAGDWRRTVALSKYSSSWVLLFLLRMSQT